MKLGWKYWLLTAKLLILPLLAPALSAVVTTSGTHTYAIPGGLWIVGLDFNYLSEAGSFTYHWSPEDLLVDPDVQNPQTVVLAITTVFFLTVTSQVSPCQASDYIMVTTRGGPLTSNPTEIPGEICSGQSVRLFSNAGGGSGNYRNSWTCIPPGNPPWISDLANPFIAPDNSTSYQVVLPICQIL
jgi:hypothetical protein